MLYRTLGSLPGLVKVIHGLEFGFGARHFLARLFLLCRHVLPLRHHARDAFVRVFLFLAFGLHRFRRQKFCYFSVSYQCTTAFSSVVSTSLRIFSACFAKLRSNSESPVAAPCTSFDLS